MFDRTHLVRVTVLSAVVVFSAATDIPRALAQCEVAKLTASDAAASDHFGSSVSIRGPVALIGARYDDDGGDSSGSAYVYRLDGGNWKEEAKLTASDAAAGDWFGETVSVSGDLAVIGAWRNDDAGEDSGAAYVFHYDGRKWIEEAKLTASDAAIYDQFGNSVSISGDVALIGAMGNDDRGRDSGSAYVFRRDGGRWQEQVNLTASDASPEDRFGRSVSINGNVAVIGASFDDSGGMNSGSAYVFRFDGRNWKQEAKLTASDAAPEDRFGRSVSISGDLAVIGAFRDNDAGPRSGSAYVFRFNGNNWIEESKLTASDGAAWAFFGVSVSIGGEVALVGAHAADGAGPDSAAYIFRFDPQQRTWIEEAKLAASNASRYDNFGYSVSLDGDVAVVGALGADARGAKSSGEAYVFDLPRCRCTGNEKLKKPKCKGRNGHNKLTTKVVRGTPASRFTIKLAEGESAAGFLNNRGRGKATFSNLPSGPGQARAIWECGLRPRQRRSYECP